MRFIYRGVRYNHEPSAMAVREAGVGGKYRGQLWQRHVLAEQPAPQPIRHLKYRGVPYTTGEIAAPMAAVEAELSDGVLSNLMPQISHLHRANIQHNIEHRLEVAKAQGNSLLVAMLEREFDEVMS